MEDIKNKIILVIDTIEDTFNINKMILKSAKKELKEINKLINSSNCVYVNKDKILNDKKELEEKCQQLTAEQTRLKKVLYRQQVSLLLLTGEDEEVTE